MKQFNQFIMSYLQRITDVLIANGCFLGNPGLYTGEMGLALFFCHYGNFTENEVYWDYVLGLLEKVQDSICEETPLDYKHGITGISSAIEYLAQEGFIEPDTDVILEAFDDRILNIDNLPNLTFEEASQL